jgi:hypothetical protein
VYEFLSETDVSMTLFVGYVWSVDDIDRPIDDVDALC